LKTEGGLVASLLPGDKSRSDILWSVQPEVKGWALESQDTDFVFYWRYNDKLAEWLERAIAS
ncbi:hypothetical protein H2203_005199, partial [Taxawa tesnikishii (nom. ined.)]